MSDEHGARAKPVDRPWKWVLFAAPFTILSACVGGPAGCAYVGRTRAERCCDQTAVGSSIDAFRERAAHGMDEVWDSTTDPADVGHGRVNAMAHGFVFLRYFCIVDHAGGKVTAKRTTSLD